jgi:hypothetical protein
MAHPQVGPGADATMTPFGVLAPQLQAYVQPFDLGGEGAHLAANMAGPYAAAPNSASPWVANNSSGPAANYLGPLTDIGLSNQAGDQTIQYWETLIDGECLVCKLHQANDRDDSREHGGVRLKACIASVDTSAGGSLRRWYSWMMLL